jgi:formate dehydrogenase iron-sulfur subunit
MYSILVDATQCTACERCVAACVETNGTDPVRAEIDRATSRDGLSADRMLSILEVGDGRFARKSCMHCLDPACVSACLVGGITKSGDGPVIYDSSKCIGCRYCMLACPFHIPRYEWDTTMPFIKKCNMCFDRVQQGQTPACVAACPNQALQFGERSALVAEAHRRIKAQPSKYLPRLWGEKEFGGTSLLYISDVDLKLLGWPPQETGAIPELTEPLIAQTPFIGASVAGSLLGVNWIIRRRMQLQREAQTNSSNEAHQDARQE